MYMVFTNEGFFWREWDLLNPRRFRPSNRLSYQVMSSACTQNQLFTATPISYSVQCSDFISAIAFVNHHV